MNVMHLAVTAVVAVLIGLLITTVLQSSADQALLSFKNLIPFSGSVNG